MAKYAHDSMMDAALSWVKTNTAQVCVCSSQPTTYSEATSTYKLGIASYTITGSPANNGSSGRQITVQAASSISITSSGNMQHIALVDSSPATLVYVTTIPASSQASVSASDTVNMAAWTISVDDPA